MKPKQNKEIKILLQRFENGESSRAEEERLGKLLQEEENKNLYTEEVALFNYFQKAKQTKLPENFVEDTLNQNTDLDHKSTTRVLKIRSFFKYASILIIALTGMYFFAQIQQDKIEKEQAKLAYLETKKAMFIISKEMNNATAKLSEIEEFTQETKKFINP